MARRTIAQPAPRQAQLSLAAKHAAIPKLQRRLGELRGFDPQTAARNSDPRVVALSQAIDRTLVDIFGAGTVDYERYKGAAEFSSDWSFGEIPLSTYRQYLAEDKDRAIATLDGIVAGFREDVEEGSADPVASGASGVITTNTRKVFVVHGHDDAALHGVARFLEQLDLKAIILREQPDKGRTIIEKFEDCAGEVGFAVVLLTPDDIAHPVAKPENNARARQNVIFELGYFAGKLGRGHACLLRKGEVEIPSDLYGVIYTEMDVAEGWKLKLAKELKAAGLKFDGDKVF